jgi:hypothetical protein
MDDTQNTPQLATGTNGSNPASPAAPDEYSTPIPQGATSAPTQQDEYSTPIPQGATATPSNITPPETGLNKFVSGLEADKDPTNPADDPDAYERGINRMAAGGIKEAANGVGNILDMLTNHGQGGPGPVSTKAAVALYKEIHKDATPQQISDFANKQIRAPQAFQKPIQEAISWLHSGGQPDGFWETVGSLGEQAAEWLGGEEALKLASAPIKIVEGAPEAIDTAKHIASAKNVMTVLKLNPKLAGIVAIGLKASQTALGSAAQNYVHTEDPNSALRAGEIGEGLGALGGAIAKPIESISDQLGNVGPKVAQIAGEDVPVAATHPQLTGAPANETATSALNINNPENLETTVEPAGKTDAATPVKNTLQHFSTPAGAQNFVDTQVQPAARKALQAGLSQPAIDSVDALRTLRGEAPLADAPPKLKTTAAIAKFMQGEAKKTYQTLDDAAQQDIDKWTEQYGEQAQSNAVKEGAPDFETQFSKMGQPSTETAPKPKITIPEKPKLFTELQDQVRDAKATIGSKASSQVDKQTAIQNLPVYEKEMKAFMAKHGGLVDPDELSTANSVYSQSKRYEWLSKQLQRATQGAEGGGLFKGDTLKYRPQALESLERQYNIQFGKTDGEDAFKKLLGPKAYNNYNDVVNALKRPSTGGGTFVEWLNSLPLKSGKVFGTIPVGALADHLLFDPDAASEIAAKFEGASKLAKAAGERVGATTAATVRPKNSSLNDSLQSASGAFQ